MDKKPIRKAVRTYLIKNNQVVVIQYLTNPQIGYYDIPGGKIEEGETNIKTAIREFKEETGMTISSPNYVGNLIVEYPTRIFDFDIFITSHYKESPKQLKENISCWIDIDELLKQKKLFSEVQLLSPKYRKYLTDNKSPFKIKFYCDSTHNILKEQIEETSDRSED